MHREIKIKQFPIVTTHWWPKTRNERFVWENEQYLYRFLPLVHNHVQVIWVHTHLVCDVCVRALWLVGVNAWRRACLKRGACPVHATPDKYVIGCCNYDGASAPRFRHALRQALTPTSQSARTHTSHTGCVCTQITWTWLCTRGKKLYKYCSFSHTNLSFHVLGHQCVVTMGNCLILISLCMFFFPLIETDTYTCHYMTDRLERFDLKHQNWIYWRKKDTYILDALGVSW